MKAERIAVIGAGIAGLTAARHFARANHEVVVFDKARGVAGRTSTRRSETGAFDHGAQYFTCRTESFARQLDDWRRRGVVAVWDAPVHRLAAGKAEVDVAEVPRYVGVPGMSALARDLARELRVECGQRIERIAGSARRWSLVAEEGATFDGFDAVVVATPAPQAVPLLAPSPQLAALAYSVDMQACHAVMVTFAGRLEVGFGGAFVTDSPLAWVARNASKPGRGGEECWVLHADAEWSARHIESPPDAVAKDLLFAFTQVLGRELPSERSLAVHRWRFARAARSLGKPYLWDADSGLGVCGDWTCGSRVEDAFTSGDLLARTMLAT